MGIGRLLALACILGWSGVAPADPPDAQSRYMPTGPPPARGYESYPRSVRELGQTVIGAVPPYLWRHGCGPTAAGMVIGYWDGQGFPALIPGDASTQTNEVQQSIASGNGTSTHYSDYSLPKDYESSGPIQPDRSEPPAGDEHPSDSLADFMETSWSSRYNYYGWSWFSDVDDAFRDYTDHVNALYGTDYQVSSWNEGWGTFTWEKFAAEIDAGRPMVFLVDTDGNGSTDHFVTAIGYRDTYGDPEYACFDTWGQSVRWERFRGLSSSYSWGIYGATYFVPTEPQAVGGPCSGRRLLVRDKLDDEVKSKIVVVSRDTGIEAPDPGSAGDPTLHGAELRLMNRSTPEQAVFPLPAEHWQGLGKDPAGSRGYRYVDREFSGGPCKLVLLKPNRALRVVCMAREWETKPWVEIPFTLDEPNGQGSLAVTLQLGSAEPLFMIFGGTILKDRPASPVQGEIGLFKAINAPAPGTGTLVELLSGATPEVPEGCFE